MKGGQMALKDSHNGYKMQMSYGLERSQLGTQ